MVQIASTELNLTVKSYNETNKQWSSTSKYRNDFLSPYKQMKDACSTLIPLVSLYKILLKYHHAV